MKIYTIENALLSDCKIVNCEAKMNLQLITIIKAIQIETAKILYDNLWYTFAICFREKPKKYN